MSSGRARRLAIASSGRFHVLDLARELDALGNDLLFYSYVPKARATSFGLPARCHVSLAPLLAPLVAWEHRAPRLLPDLLERTLHASLNRATMLRLKPCDIFHCMSGIYLEAAAYAKSRFGARVHLDRGSRHILSQREILAAFPAARGPTDRFVARELAGYALADRIVVPSSQVAESFARDPTAAKKLVINPYGVDLAMFPQRADAKVGRTALFVGGWSYRKGADVLATAIRKLKDVRLVHVGPLGDVEFPSDERFQHNAPVEQNRLADHYRSADLMVLASREEGLALVQAQALASGLPLVCTDRTGGRNLGHTPRLQGRIREVPNGDAEALAEAIGSTLADIEADRFGVLDESDRAHLSWRAYGDRYNAILKAER